LLAGLLAAPGVAQGPGTFTVGLNGQLSDVDTSLPAGLVTLTNGTSLNLNGILVPGGVTAIARNIYNGYNVNGAGDPQLENLPDARAAFNALGTPGIYSPPPPSDHPTFSRGPAPEAVNFPSQNDPLGAQPWLPGNVFNNYNTVWKGELTITTAGSYSFGTR